MTMEEFYKQAGGNYKEVYSRLRSKDRILKFILKFPSEPSFETLRQALSTNNMREAVRASKMLEDACLNLGFGSLYNASRELAEYLNIGGSSDIATLWNKVEETYNRTVAAIGELQGQEMPV